MKLLKPFSKPFFTRSLMIASLLLPTGCKNWFSQKQDSTQNTTVISSSGENEQASQNSLAVINSPTTDNTASVVRQRTTPRRPATVVPALPPQETFQSTPFFSPQPIGENTYTVQKGDTLWKIARQHGVKVREILEVNLLNDKSVLVPGQTLRIPNSSHHGFEFPSSHEGGQYTVQKGDTLAKIAKKFKVSVEQIKQANDLSSDKILERQSLILPGVSEGAIAQHKHFHANKKVSTTNSETNSTPWSGGDEYTVQKGDTLAKIAKKAGVNLQKLIDINQISNPRALRIGQKLKLKGDAEVVSTSEIAPMVSEMKPMEATTISSAIETSEPTEPKASTEASEHKGNSPAPEPTTENNVENLFEDTNAIPVVPIEEEA